MKQYDFVELKDGRVGTVVGVDAKTLTFDIELDLPTENGIPQVVSVTEEEVNAVLWSENI